MNNKSLILLLSGYLFLAPVSGEAQNPLKKIYAYKQATISGVNKNTGLNNQAEQKQTHNYWVYMVVKKSEHITITEMWLSGKKYSVKTEPVKDLPVKKIDYSHPPENDTILLVPNTKNSVLLTYPSGEVKDPGPVSRYFSDLITTHELVITYYYKGKKYYKISKKIIELKPESAV